MATRGITKVANPTSSIPMISIASVGSTGRPKSTVVDAVDEACRDTGFFVIMDHGVPIDLINEVDAVSRAFFELPMEQKMECVGDGFHAYGPPKGVAGHEIFHVSHYDNVRELRDAGYSKAIAERIKLNIWPTTPPNLRSTWRWYYGAMEDLARRLLRVFEAGLDLPAGWFDSRISRHTANMSANYYPKRQALRESEERFAAHTDLSLFTMVYQDASPGSIEVCTRDGSWITVPPIPGSFVVNLGRIMMRLTNGLWPATPHRVPDPPADSERERLSIPFFFFPNYDMLIEPLSHLVDDVDGAKYLSISVGEFAEWQMSTFYG